MDVSKDHQLGIWFYILLPPSTGMQTLCVFPALELKIKAGKRFTLSPLHALAGRCKIRKDKS